MPTPAPKVLLLSGSMGSDSLTLHALEHVARRLRSRGVATRVVRAGDVPVPLLDPDAEEPPAASAFRAAVRESDALVVATPDYHGGYSGALKNLLDHLRSDDVRGKPVALVASAGGARGGMGALDGLRLVFRSLHALAIAEQVAVSRAEWGEAHASPAPAVARRLDRLADELASEVELRAPRRDASSAPGVVA